MSRHPFAEMPDGDAWRLLERVSAADAPRMSQAEQIELVQTLRGRSPQMAAAVDQSLVLQIHCLRQGLLEARDSLEEIGATVAKLTSPPWHPAVFLGPLSSAGGHAAVVACNGSMRVVSAADGVSIDELAVGDEILLGQGMNVVMQALPHPLVTTGETARFERRLPDGRLVLGHRDEEIVVRAAASLHVERLAPGDAVRWRSAAGLALERIEHTQESHLFLEQTPSEGFEQIGGLDAQIARLTRALRLHMLHADVAGRYRLRRASSVLLVGPPGTGKTMTARALANWLARHSPSGHARFLHVKPAALHSMWYGESEKRYRDTFRIAREAGQADSSTPVVMFFDEVDAIGHTRGQSVTRVDDRVLASFLAELDGLEGRGNILVVAATNRRDMLDPALARPGRLGDLVIDIPRPGLAAAAAIFDRHLPAIIPYAANGSNDDGEQRRRIIEAAVSRLYAPNGEGEVAWITFRDGTRRAVHARDVVSGAHIANIARSAIERACVREIEQGESGVALHDVLDAVANELATVVGALTPANCHVHVGDLPQDLGVARVEPVARQVRRPHRFLNVA